jgi:hypothetical protein
MFNFIQIGAADLLYQQGRPQMIDSINYKDGAWNIKASSVKFECFEGEEPRAKIMSNITKRCTWC